MKTAGLDCLEHFPGIGHYRSIASVQFTIPVITSSQSTGTATAATRSASKTVLAIVDRLTVECGWVYTSCVSLQRTPFGEIAAYATELPAFAVP